MTETRRTDQPDDDGRGTAPAIVVVDPPDGPPEEVTRRPAGGVALSQAGPTSTGDRLRDWFRYTRGRGALEIGVIFVLLQIACVVASLLFPEDFRYLSTANFNVITQSLPILGLLAVGVGILMVAGEFDLSIGLNYTFCALVFANAYASGWGGVGAAFLAVAVGMGIALLNGLIVVTFGLPSFIVTLAAYLFWGGAGVFFTNVATDGASALIRPSETLTNVFRYDFGFFRGQMLWLIGAAVIAWILLHRHKTGNHIYAVGGNPSAARAISINPKAVKLICFALLGVTAALAGIIATVQTGTIQPNSGQGLELRAIAAAVVGGCALTGGRGSVLGMVLGAALLVTIQDIILLAGLQALYLDLFIGVGIVAFALLNQWLDRKAA